MYDVCRHVYIYRENDENINKYIAQTKGSIKHVSNTHGVTIQNKKL